MTKFAVIRATAVAAVVGVAALVVGYLYQNGDIQSPSGVTDGSQQAAAPSGQEPPADAGSPEASDTQNAETAPQSEAAEAPPSDTAQSEDGTDLGAPSFDVVSVEPSGSTVVAGRAEAGSIVALTANGQVVGKAIADANGEWTIIVDDPLSAGDYDVALQTQNEDGSVKRESSQRLAVSIPEGGKDRPLVVLNAPDAPSTLLQVPEPEDTGPAAESQVASADPAERAADANAAAEATARKALEESLKSAADAAAMPQSETGQTEAAQNEAVQNEVANAAAGTTQAPAEIPADTPQAGASSTGDTPTETLVAAADSAAEPERETDPTPASDTTAAAIGEESDTDAADAASATEAETVQTAEPTAPDAQPEAERPQITVEAVEAESGKVYAAGTGMPGTNVNVYVADILLGIANVGDNGRWLIEGEMGVAAGSVEVRADMLLASGDVVARAAVTFEKEAEAIVLTKVTASAKGTSETAAAGASVEKPLPNVIIRKGDNLWRISRRLYGDGFRYTTIYQANKSQIRDPDLIYPGQVFLTPEGDLNWQPAQN